MVAEREMRVKMEDLDCSVSLSSLLCQEDDLFSFEFKDTNSSSSRSTNSNLCFSEAEDEEYILQLIQKEDGFASNSENPIEIWLREARLDAIKWIYNRRAFFGFSFVTAFLSIAYFDRFISKRSIVEGEQWAVRLLTMACFSVAAKMEEPNVPPCLSRYHTENYNFGSNLITRMECLILTSLDWKMSLITPLHYLPYFINKFFFDYNDISSQVSDLVLDAAKGIDLAEIRPSVIAVAAILVCCDDRLTTQERETKIIAISSWGSIEEGDIYSCYNLMRGSETTSACTPHSMVLSSSSFNVQEKSLVSFASNKRRRLTYFGDYYEYISKKRLS